MYVNVARGGQESDDWQEPDDAWLELDGGESEDDRGVYCINAFMGGEDLGVKEKFEYYSDVSPSWEEGTEEKSEEERWRTPDLLWLQSKEEDE
jgi:hypothetical protein